MRRMVQRAGLALAVLSIAGVPAARASHSREIDRRYARALESAQKGDYWRALHDAETIVKADPGWADGQQLYHAAGYEAHFREGLRLIDSGDWEHAGKQLENARVYKDTPALAGTLRMVEEHLQQQAMARKADAQAEAAQAQARSAAATAFSQRLDGIAAALEAGDRRLADERIREMPSAGDLPLGAAHANLVAPLRLYTAGRTADARLSARALASAGDPAAAALVLFLNARLRQEVWPAGLRVGAPLYGLALLASLYWGLRREARGGVR